LVVSDVAIGDDPRGGLRVQVHGHELVAQKRADHEKQKRQAQAKADAEIVRGVLTAQPGLGARELRAAVRAAGLPGVDRLSDALAHLGQSVEFRDEVHNRARVTRHYLRGDAK
jgi:hypothetical protein